jgi:hypothetical protein
MTPSRRWCEDKRQDGALSPARKERASGQKPLVKHMPLWHHSPTKMANVRGQDTIGLDTNN